MDVHGWRQFLQIWLTSRHILFWILTVHGQLDREQQPEDSRNMRCNMALRHSFALATSPCVFANSEMEICWESCIIHFPLNILLFDILSWT